MNPPAFPRAASVDPTSGTLPDGDRVIPATDGMTLRDYFAGQALASLAPYTVGDKLASECYRIADSMLAERTKGGAS